jgi:hypothetical protein
MGVVMRHRSQTIELDRAKGHDFLDREARAKLGISADEFLRLHDAGALDRTDQAVLDVEILIPFAR